jgi:hypothetical protein
VAPVAAWLLLAPGPSDRTVALHMFGADYLGQAARPFSRWLIPWPKPPLGLFLAVLLIAGAVVLARRRPAPLSSLGWLLAAFSVAYLAVLLGNRALTDATGRLDARFLAPLHVVAILVAVPVFSRRPLAKPALALAGVLVLAQIVDAAAWTAGGLTDDSIARRGYTAAALQHSALLADPGGLLYSNAPDAVFFLTGRSVLPIPAEKEYLTGRPNPRYAEELDAMHGYLLYFDAITFRRSFLPTRAELEAALPLEVVYRDEVATVYRLR